MNINNDNSDDGAVLLWITVFLSIVMLILGYLIRIGVIQ